MLRFMSVSDVVIHLKSPFDRYILFVSELGHLPSHDSCYTNCPSAFCDKLLLLSQSQNGPREPVLIHRYLFELETSLFIHSHSSAW